MNALRVEADESAAKNDELNTKIKALEQENLAKEQEITSLSHKNQVLEAELEKLEAGLKDAKSAADESSQHGTQNESLQRRLQLLEEEAEEADKNLRETNDKYVPCGAITIIKLLLLIFSQTPSDRCQGRPLRTQGTSSRDIKGSMGAKVRGDGQEVRRDQEGARRLRCRDWQHLSNENQPPFSLFQHHISAPFYWSLSVSWNA